MERRHPGEVIPSPPRPLAEKLLATVDLNGVTFGPDTGVIQASSGGERDSRVARKRKPRKDKEDGDLSPR